ncbi:MAG: sodium:solute symporter [Acidobacteriota bacterium]
MTLAVILIYLAAVLLVGVLGHRLFRGTGEDYFLATRTIGPFVLLMSLFGTHMTAFSLLGASGEAYHEGVGVFGLMASSSALVVPLVFLGVGTRLYRCGKRLGHVTQVQYFRERWESDGLGLLLFIVTVALVIPYLLIGVMGGGIALNQITGGDVPEWVGGLMICGVVLGYVTTGGLRSTAWANTFQTLVFMILGGVAFAVVVHDLGGLDAALDRVAAVSPSLLVPGQAMPLGRMVSYTLIPLSVGMFPHIFMHWLTARRVETFRLTVILYPLCVAVVWLPSVLMGLFGAVEFPGLAGPAANAVLVKLIHAHAPDLLAGLLGAGVFAAVMSSLDSQTLSLGTMFARDIVLHHGFQDHLSERYQVILGRLFVSGVLLVTFLLSLVADRSIFRLGIWSFTGFAALFPLVVAALFWRRSTAAGAIAAVLTMAVLWVRAFVRSGGGASSGPGGLMPVASILAASAAALVVVSLVTRPPSPAALARFFPEGDG